MYDATRINHSQRALESRIESFISSAIDSVEHTLPGNLNLNDQDILILALSRSNSGILISASIKTRDSATMARVAIGLNLLEIQASYLEDFFFLSYRSLSFRGLDFNYSSPHHP